LKGNYGEAFEEMAGEAIEGVDTKAEPIRVDTKPDIVETEAELGTKSRVHNSSFCDLIVRYVGLKICYLVPVSVSNFYSSMLLLGTVAKTRLALETLNHRRSV